MKRRRPIGCVYRRGKVWWLKWTDVNGKPVYRSSGSSSREAAERMLRDEVARRDRGLAPAPDPRATKVDDLLTTLQADYETRGRRSLGRLKDACAHLLRLFRGVQAARVTGADITRYAQLRLAEDAAVATVNRELAALRRGYRLGLAHGVVAAVPAISTLPERNARTGFVEREHMDSICRRLPPDEADLVRFCFITGWRWQSEAVKLTWAQVDFAAGFVRLEPHTTKNDEGREFPLIPELRAMLERRLAVTKRLERAQARVIPCVFHRRGLPIRSLRRSWKTATKAAGRPGTILHDLRRSAVRNLERANVSRSVAMRLTGHKTEAIYRRYAIVSTNDLREAGSKLAALGDNPGSLRLQAEAARAVSSGKNGGQGRD